MNIYALPGYKVKVTEDSKLNGYDYDKENIEKYLEIEKEYTIDHTKVENWSTKVYLKEIPNITFNSVNFVGCSLQSKIEDTKHPDWKRYN